MIPAGKLGRVEILRFSNEERDELNAPIERWVSVGHRSAERQDVSDTERVAAEAAGSVLTSRFIFRWSPLAASIKAPDRLIGGGETFAVSGRRLIGRRDRIEVTAAVMSEP